MSENKNLCKRCMLDESLTGLETAIDDYVATLDDDIKVDVVEYERRLKLCAECSQLQNGVCRMCGCFVKARAAKKSMSCPDITAKW